jgi:hypothetical protein
MDETRAVQTKAMATKLSATAPWPPTRITRVIRGLETSTGPLYVTTDAGRAYVNTLGNPEGCGWHPEVLFVGTVGIEPTTNGLRVRCSAN